MRGSTYNQPKCLKRFHCLVKLHCETGEKPSAPRGSSFTNAKLQRHRATTNFPPKTKKNHEPPIQLRQGINICLTTIDPVNLSLHGNAMMPIAPGEVNLYLVILCCAALSKKVLLKPGAGGAAADRSQRSQSVLCILVDLHL